MGKRHGRTNGWGTIAARAFSAAPGAVLVVALAGCSSELQDHGTPAELPAGSAAADTQTSAQAPAGDADRPAFHFASGDLVLGDFNYEDIAGNIFNPCEEISAEELAAIGFEKDETIRRSDSRGVLGCALVPVEKQDSKYLLSGGSGNRKNTQVQRNLLEHDASGVVPGTYTYVFSDEDDAEMCGAAVDTERGQLGVTVGQLGSNGLRDEFCERSVEVIEALYVLNQ